MYNSKQTRNTAKTIERTIYSSCDKSIILEKSNPRDWILSSERKSPATFSTCVLHMQIFGTSACHCRSSRARPFKIAPEGLSCFFFSACCLEIPVKAYNLDSRGIQSVVTVLNMKVHRLAPRRSKRCVCIFFKSDEKLYFRTKARIITRSAVTIQKPLLSVPR